MRCNQIGIVDNILITEEGKAKLQGYSKKWIEFPIDDPKDYYETISRIGQSEVALVSLRTPLDERVFRATPNLKYILACSTSTKGIDLVAAASYAITVKNINNYCDEATAEFVISNILNLFRRRNQEIYRKRMGVIGCGAVGKLVIDYGIALGMDVYCHSSSRKEEVEKKGAKFVSLSELLKLSEVISLHTPSGLKILERNHFKLMGNDKIIVNTAVGEVMDRSGFEEWIKLEGNTAIFDAVSGEQYHDHLAEGILISDKVAGYTKEAKERMTQKIFENLDQLTVQI